MPLGLLFYNPSREAKLPIGANVISVTVADKRITDRHTVLRVTNILFQYNRGYWENGYKNCPQPKVIATFEVKKILRPLHSYLVLIGFVPTQRLMVELKIFSGIFHLKLIMN
jgi:hypothetical protein